MAFDNTVTVVGNLTRDPELRFTPNGAAVASFGLAWNRRNQNGEDETSFFDVTCWRSLAENVSDSLSKGTRVIVYGRLEQRSWENQEGERRSKVEVIADDVAPSLKWATAEITKNEFRGGGDGGGGGASRGGGDGGGGGASRGGSPAPAPSAPPSYDVDEEPF